MRLNRGTLILLLVSLAVIVGVVLVSNNPTQMVAPTPTPADGGPLLPELEAESVTSLAIIDNADEAFVRLSRTEAAAAWTVSGPADSAEREVDQDAANAALANALDLTAETRFEVEDLADFGLDTPSYTIEVDTGADSLNWIQVGSTNPGGNRYYVQPRQVTIGADGQTEMETSNEVWLVNSTVIEALTDLIANPPYVPLPTATPTATATLNPLSEVEQATATAEAQATATAVIATIQAEAEATAETTLEVEVIAEPEATAETTEEPE